MTKSRVKKIGWLVGCWALLMVPCAAAHPMTPTYWKQRLFFIPYRANQSPQQLAPIAKVQLLYSRTGSNDWITLEEAEPNVQGFSYHAPEDGEYWFALRHLDRHGQPWPSADLQPQMRLVIDTQTPQLALHGSPDAPGQIVIRYEAQDANLKPESLQLEVLGSSGHWTPLRITKPDIIQPDRLLGRVQWQVPADLQQVQLRASISDRAGQRAQAKTTVANRLTSIAGPTLSSPRVKIDKARTAPHSQTITNPFGTARQLPSQDWPASNHLSPSQVTASRATTSRPAPPTDNPYAVTGKTHRTPAKLVGDGAAALRQTPGSHTKSQSLSITPLGPDNAPSAPTSTPWPSTLSDEPESEQWTPARQASDEAVRVVNSRTFDVQYDLDAIGPWGVAKVELWGTQDSGRSWQSYGVDPDNRSPIRITVPEAGRYGFRILVDGANSAGAAPPRAGDNAELIVSVDLQPPAAELLAADLGTGNLADHLQVRWTATDTNLEPRPIALFYSSYPNGPWSTIATGLENTGSYTWRIERHLPARFYLRLEARDIAGNSATFQTPSPITLARPQPTGRLRSVQSVTQ